MDYVHSAVFSPDGSSVLTASNDETAKVWSAETGECTQTLSGHGDAVRSAIFSPDGSWVLTSSQDRTANIWSAETGECLQTLSGHGAAVRSAVFSPDGSRVHTASEDETAKIWSAETGERTQTLSDHMDDHWDIEGHWDFSYNDFVVTCSELVEEMTALERRKDSEINRIAPRPR